MSDTNTLVKLLKEGYKAGHTLEVTFTKANGDIRKMIVQRNDELESNVKGIVSKHTDSVMRVCERLTTDKPEGEFQWRSIPLNRLITVEDITPF